MSKTGKIHVLFVSSWFPSNSEPFNGNFVLRHAEAVAEYCKVSFVNVTSDPLEDKSKLLISDKIKIYEKQISKNYLFNSFRIFQLLFYYFKLFKKISRDRGRPDILHANVVFPSAVYAYLFKQFTGIPYIISEHWTGHLPANRIKQSFFTLFLSKLAIRSASAVCPVTADLKNAMIAKKLKGKYYVIPNVTNLKYFYPSQELKNNKIKRIIHISSLYDQHKNITGIINVVKQLFEIRQDFEIIILGDGNAQPHIDYAKKRNLYPEPISFKGPSSPVEIGDFMRQSDLLFLFSNYENFPCVIVEALAAGIPVLSTDVGGIREHLTPNNGVLVKSGDEESAVKELNRLFNNLEKYNSQNLYNYAVKNFSYNAVGEKFLNLYNRSISNK